MSEQAKPRAFTDSAGRAWVVSLTVGDFRPVKSLTGVDLGRLAADGWKPLADLLDDPPTLVDVLYVLCRPQCDAAGVTDEQFGRAFDGDVVEAAADAFLGAFADFSPSRPRALLLRLAEKGREVRERAATLAAAALETLEPAAIFAGSAGSSPASSASTPAR